MGLWQKVKGLQEKNKERKVAKYTKTVKNAKAIKEDRVAALEYFKGMDDMETAVPVLLLRFEYSLEHGINDTREKESALAGITKYGDQALELIKEHLKNTTRIAWPIKALNAVGSETDVVNVLQDVLDFGDVSFDQAKVDKNYDVLCYLADYEVPGLADRLKKFLDDPDERVRFACVEFLVRQSDEGIKDLLEKFLADDTNENRRIRATVIDAFVEHSWRIEDMSKFEPGLLTEGVFVTKKAKLERR